MKQRRRQAVVVIHGIGEQRPQGTLRAFTAGITDGLARSKPDRLSESFELRRFSLPSTRSRPLTDIYELYWAHHMKHARWSATLSWMARLLVRRPSSVPPALRSVYRLFWIAMASALALTAYSAWRAFEVAGWSFFESMLTYAPLAVLAIQALVGRAFLGYLGDAARYLTPDPPNIEVRRKIRAEGVQLLRRLHDSGSYFRVVVVGHSLGSVIGYDVLRHLWDEYRWPSFEAARSQPEAEAFDTTVSELESDENRTAAVERFQQAQHRLWREQRGLGTRWLVTDFVTLGSPLVHAELLLEDPVVSLERRKIERELPSCPPSCDRGDEVHYGETHDIVGAQPPRKFYFRIPHHGAPFACTRWTNLYFPHRRLILGDIIGGPLGPVFGRGIRDIPLRPSVGGPMAATLVSHVLYWRGTSPVETDREARRRRDDKTGTREAVHTLRWVLRLDSGRSNEKWPPPPPPPG